MIFAFAPVIASPADAGEVGDRGRYARTRCSLTTLMAYAGLLLTCLLASRSIVVERCLGRALGAADCGMLLCLPSCAGGAGCTYLGGASAFFLLASCGSSSLTTV